MSLETFDEQLQKFFKHCVKILEYKSSLNPNEKKNIPLEHLNKYTKAASKSKHDFMRDEFWAFFLKHKAGILRGYTRHEWLSSERAAVALPYGITSVKSDAIKLHLSIIYREAMRIRNDAEEQVDNLPEGMPEELLQKQELIYPEIFMLHLYRIFREAAKSKLPAPGQTAPQGGEDIRSHHAHLSKLVLDIEKAVGQKPGDDAGENFSPSGLMSIAKGFAKQIGIPIPEDAPMPDEKEAMLVMKELFNQPEAKKTTAKLFQDLQECKDPSEVLGKMVSNLNDPKLAEVIQNTLSTTVAGAQAKPPGTTAASTPAAVPAVTTTPPPAPMESKDACTDDVCLVIT